MSILDIDIRPAGADDLPAIIALLAANALPTEDLTPATIRHFVVATAGNAVIGVAGLEVFGSDGLLRSLAVDANYRGHRLGARLMAEIETRSKDIGIGTLYLLTTTAAAFMQRCAYQGILRDAVPDAIGAHPQFRGLCPARAACLRKRLA